MSPSATRALRLLILGFVLGVVGGWLVGLFGTTHAARRGGPAGAPRGDEPGDVAR